MKSMIRKCAFWLLKKRLIGKLFNHITKIFGLTIKFDIPASGKLALNISGKGFCMISDGKDSIASRLFYKGEHAFESETIPVFIKLLGDPKCRVFIDVGANTGVYSLVAASHSPDLEIHCFEPMPDIYHRLKCNLRVNNFQHAAPHNVALGAEASTSTIYYSNGITVPTGASLEKDYWPDMEKAEISVQTLDEFVEQNSLGSLDLLKIDTEMTEPQVLAGGIRSLKKYRPNIICEILDQKTGDEIRKLLEPIGYRFYHVTQKGLTRQERIEHDSTYQFNNFLLLHENNLEANCIANLRLD